MTRLAPGFYARPFTHRGLHDQSNGIPENSRAAFEAAISAGYGIELDLQLSADGVAMVFHDYALDRLTEDLGPVRLRTAAELGAIPLKGGDEGISTLSEVLSLVGGRAPILIEIKDQDGALGPDVGRLEEAVAGALRDYHGPVAVMSFNPHSIAEMKRLAPEIPRGLTTCDFPPKDWTAPLSRLEELREIADIEPVGAAFISHDRRDLTNPRVRELKEEGLAIFCWTVRTPDQAEEALKIADQITFEGFKPAP